MALLLRVTGTPAKGLGDGYTHVFGLLGGCIGRHPDCDWVLPDPELYVSNTHATVALQDGQWLLTDTSSNGIRINNEPEPMPPRSSRPIADYDRIHIGPYEILARLMPDR